MKYHGVRTVFNRLKSKTFWIQKVVLGFPLFLADVIPLQIYEKYFMVTDDYGEKG